MKLKFVYVRHGKTLFNTIGRMQGVCDSPLTEKGIRGAEDTASALCKMHFDRAYCSSSERARDTAEILLKGRSMTAKPLKELKEFSYGSYDGEESKVVEDRLAQEYFVEDWTDVGGENIELFKERSDRAFAKMTAEAKDGETILVAGHGSYFMHLLKTLLNVNREEYIVRRKKEGKPLMPNCSIAMFSYEDGVYTLDEEPMTADEYRRRFSPKHVDFFFVRHGQTMFNVQNRMQGRCDSPLTEKGIQQAEKAAERLKNQPITKAYVSSSERAMDTAEIILRSHNLEAQIDKRLCEVFYGYFEASLQNENVEEVMKRHENEEWSDAGGENQKQVMRRISDFLRDAADHADDGETVLLVSHGNLYLNYVEYFGRSRKDLFEEAFAQGRNPMPNCGVFAFAYDSETGFSVTHYMD